MSAMNSSTPLPSPAGVPSPALALPALPALDNTYGALVIGCIVSAALWGVGSLQCYLYYLRYPKDKVSLKALVAVVWALDTVQQALIGHVGKLYYYLVKHYFNPLDLDFYVWSLNVQSLFEALTSLGVQGFYVYRIARLSDWNYTLIGITSILVAAKFGAGIAYVARGVPIHSITLAFEKLHATSEAINGLSVATDVGIAAIMIVLLARGRTKFSKTNALIDRLILYSVESSALTSLCSVISLITATTMRHNFVYGAFYFLVARLYVNSMLATLNSRKSAVMSGNNSMEMSATEYTSTTGQGSVAFGKVRFGESTTRFKVTKTSEVTVSSDADLEGQKAPVSLESDDRSMWQ